MMDIVQSRKHIRRRSHSRGRIYTHIGIDIEIETRDPR